MRNLLLLLCLASQDPGDGSKERTEIMAGINALAIQTPWSKVPWKTCLIDAYAQARTEHKPVLIWALGGYPEGRC